MKLEDSVKFVLRCFSEMKIGEVFVPKLYSFKIIDLAKILSPGTKHKFVGIRPGEKLDELLPLEENRNILNLNLIMLFLKIYMIRKNLKEYLKIKAMMYQDFYYSSNNNQQFL